MESLADAEFLCFVRRKAEGRSDANGGEGREPSPPELDNHNYLIVTVTFATLLSAFPSLVLNVKESCPFALAVEV